MQINLQLEYADTTKKLVVAKAADFVAFETEFNISIAKLEQEVKYTHLLYLAWHAEKRTKATELSFEDWVNQVESIEAEPAKKSKG